MSNVVNCNRKAAFVCHVETLSVVEEIYDLFSMHHLPRNFLMKTSSSPLLTCNSNVDAKQEELKRAVNFLNFCQAFHEYKIILYNMGHQPC